MWFNRATPASRWLVTAAVATAAFAVFAYILLATSDRASGSQVTDTSIAISKDEIIGNNQPAGDVVVGGVPDANAVDIAVVGAGDLKLTIAGPVECDPRWVSPADNFPSVIAGFQTSVVTVPAVTAPGLTALYSVTCPLGGLRAVNITAHLTPGAGEDTTNNLDENWVQIAVTCDGDLDGVCNPQDNCPNDANPGQADTDADGAGDACDSDDDEDGWLDTVEVFTGTKPLQGCATSWALNDEDPDSQPSDMNDDRTTTLADVVAFGPGMNKVSPNPGYRARYDLNMNGSITVADIVPFGPHFNQSC